MPLLTEKEGEELLKCIEGEDDDFYTHVTLYEKLYDHYLWDMPTAVAKARDGDPADWILNQAEHDFDRLVEAPKLDKVLFQEPKKRKK